MPRQKMSRDFEVDSHANVSWQLPAGLMGHPSGRFMCVRFAVIDGREHNMWFKSLEHLEEWALGVLSDMQTVERMLEDIKNGKEGPTARIGVVHEAEELGNVMAD